MAYNYTSPTLSDGSISSASTSTPAVAPVGSDPSSTRLASSGLGAGAINLLQDIAGKAFNFSFQNTNGQPIQPEADWRVRISMQPYTASLFYNNPTNSLMNTTLARTNGVVFPYTPTVALAHNARYGTSQLTHANYSSYFYEGSEVQSITISGDFTVQNIAEGQYLMATVQFFRACTKMFFGASDLAGTPPPMVFLDGYGAAYLPHVPCVVTSFNHTMPGDVDYVNIPVGANLNNLAGNQATGGNGFGIMTRLPTMSTISITLQPVYSRNNIARNFTLEGFTQGGLIQGSTSPQGGFL